MLVSSKSLLPPNLTRSMVWGVIIIYAGALVVRSVYQNFRMNHEIEQHQIKITQLEQRKRENQLALIYYSSSAFREIEARRRLNLRGPDEHVVVLKNLLDSNNPSTIDAVTGLQTEVTYKPWQTWWNLIFKPKSSSSSNMIR